MSRLRGQLQISVSATTANRTRKPVLGFLALATIGCYAILATPITPSSPTAGQRDRNAIQISFPPNGLGLERNEVNVRGTAEFESTPLHPIEFKIGQRKEADATLVNETFQTRLMKLPRGLNLIEASVPNLGSDLVGVIAPTLAFHFDRDAEDWQQKTFGGLIEPNFRDAGGVSTGYVSGSRDDRPLDVIFVIDRTESVGFVYESARNFTLKMINKLKRTQPNCRIGFVTFGDRENDARYKRETIKFRDFQTANSDLTFIEKADFTGGGTYPEDQHLGIARAIDEFENDANPNHARCIIVLTDASQTESDTENTTASITTRANANRIPIFTAVIHHKPTQRPWSENTQNNEEEFQRAILHSQILAAATGGQAIELLIDSNAREFEAAEDDDSASISQQIQDEIKSQIAVQKIANKRQCEIISEELAKAVSASPTSLVQWVGPLICVRQMQRSHGEFLHVSIKSVDVAEVFLRSGDDAWIGTLNCLTPISSPSNGWRNFQIQLSNSSAWRRSDIPLADPENMSFTACLAGLDEVRIAYEIDGRSLVSESGIDRFLVTLAHQKESTLSNLPPSSSK